MKKQVCAALSTMLCGIGYGGAVHAQPQQNFDAVEVHSLQVRDNIYMLVGAGGNITMQVGEDGILLVDTQYAPLSQKILAEIRKISDKPIHYIVNTHHHGDHTGGNVNLRAAGATVTGGNVAGTISDSAVGALIVAHENVLNHLAPRPARRRCRPLAGRRTPTSARRRRCSTTAKASRFCTCRPRIRTATASCSSAARTSISAGDVFVTTSYPGHRSRERRQLRRHRERARSARGHHHSRVGQDGGTLRDPGHGRLSNLGDVLNFREMVIVIRDRMQDMIDKGMTLEQVKAAKPTFDYDPVYGSTTGFLDHGPLHRGGVPEPQRNAEGRTMNKLRHSALAAALARRRCVARRHVVRRATGRAPAAAAAPGEANGADRSHGAMGVDRDRGLALSDGDAAEGRSPGCHSDARGRRGRASWDPAKDEAAGKQCKAYGAAGNHAQCPGACGSRGRTTQTLQIETDAGRQTRLLHFGTVADPAEPTWQGVSRAEWMPHGGGRRRAAGQRQPQGGHDAHEGGLSAQERRSV